MKFSVLPIAVAALLAPLTITACKPAGKAPATGFRLSVEDKSISQDEPGAMLSIRPAAASTLSVDQDGGHTSILLPDPDGTGSPSGSVFLSGKLSIPPGDDEAQLQTLIRVQTSPGNHGGGPSTQSVPRATMMEDLFSITAKDGDYPFDTPVEIARLKGKPVTLTVGKPTK